MFIQTDEEGDKKKPLQKMEDTGQCLTVVSCEITPSDFQIFSTTFLQVFVVSLK